MRKIYQSDIEKYDRTHNTSLLRELEMTLELGTNNNVPLQLQFFKDLQVYGLNEAITYVLGSEQIGQVERGTTDRLRKVAQKIKEKLS